MGFVHAALLLYGSAGIAGSIMAVDPSLSFYFLVSLSFAPFILRIFFSFAQKFPVFVASMVAALNSLPAAVLVALRSHHTESKPSMMESGLWAIGSLSQGNATNQAQLGRFGACKGECWARVSFHSE